MKRIITVLVCAIVLAGGLFFFRRFTLTDQAPEPAVFLEMPRTDQKENESRKKIFASSIPGAAPVFDFAVSVPSQWEVESVPAIETLNFYDPGAEGENNLEKSQVFVRYFRANRFLTLSTVTIHSRRETEIIGRPAIAYDIEKKPGVPDFPNQPGWRSGRHFVTDIREGNSNPSVFFVFAKRPDLSEETFSAFLESIGLNASASATLAEPVPEFRGRITKKPFGMFITPETSPVQPERFHGYHTGADAEFGDVAEDVPVFAIADGTVVKSGIAQGYGGVVAIRHVINGMPYLAVYGHLDPKTLTQNGNQVPKGAQLGILGDAFTYETGDERKHLHLGIYAGADTNIQGYVASSEELIRWSNPTVFFE